MATAFCALWLPQEAGQKLGVVGGEPLEELHLTLFMADVAFEEHTKLASYIKGFVNAEATPSLSGETTGVGVFSEKIHDNGDAFYVSTSIPGLLEYRRNLVGRAGLFADIWTTFEWNPHITIKYLNMNEPFPYTRAPLIPIDFEEVVLRVKDEAQTIEYRFPMNKSGDVVVNL